MTRSNGLMQRRKGNSLRQELWLASSISFCTTRAGLLRCVARTAVMWSPSALAKLTALPEHHAMQNLDVHGTDQAQADDQPNPPVSAKLWSMAMLVILRLAAAHLLLPSL